MPRLLRRTSAPRLARCGDLHSLHLNAAGDLYACGGNGYGQLGIGLSDGANQPTWMYVYGALTGVFSGRGAFRGHRLWGNLFCWGSNAFGQVGDGTFTTQYSPKHVPSITYATALSQGPEAYHSVVLCNRPIMLSAVRLSATTVKGGTSLTGTVTLSAKAGAGGLVVKLSSSSTAAVVPASVTVPSGLNAATFTVTTKAVTAVTKPTIKGTLVVEKSAVLTINP